MTELPIHAPEASEIVPTRPPWRQATARLALAVGVVALLAAVTTVVAALRGEPGPVAVAGTIAAEAPGPVVALTFDDGPSEHTAQVLAVLTRHQVNASFFIQGDQAQDHQQALRQTARAGHQLGNHSWSHRDMLDLTDDEIRQEIDSTQRAVERYAGVTPTLFRYPFGASDRRTQNVLDEKGMAVVKWNVAPTDWESPPPATLVQRVLESVRTDRINIVLLHDGGGDRSNTVAALDPMITKLKAAGYRFIAL